MLDRDSIDKLWDKANEEAEPGKFIGYAFAHAIARMVYEDAEQACRNRVTGDNTREDAEARRCGDAIRERAKELK